jgi:alkanesulfonate monooxygenase SsuD/methylene tetrahydromethanopterin reductase-like flavin-dependent oxidoreductase (luciferase family)
MRGNLAEQLDGGAPTPAESSSPISGIAGALAIAATSSLGVALIARAIVGDPDTVRQGLAAKAEATGADELFVMAVGPDLASRVRSLELIKAG